MRTIKCRMPDVLREWEREGARKDTGYPESRLREKPILAFCFVENKARELSTQDAEELRGNRCRGKPPERAGRKARGLKRSRLAARMEGKDDAARPAQPPCIRSSIFTRKERRTKNGNEKEIAKDVCVAAGAQHDHGYAEHHGICSRRGWGRAFPQIQSL